MVDERTTPEDALEDPADDTPAEQEPAVEEAPEERPDQPAPGVIAQAEYTRATQLNAAVRKSLGLEKGATIAQFEAAIEALRVQAEAAPEGDGEAEEEVDPRLAAAQQRAFEAELRVQKAVYGDEFTDEALAFINLARTSDDLDELFSSLAAMRQQASAPESPATAAPTEPGPAGAIDTSEGDRATASESPAPSGRRESGVVTALRGLFQAAAEQRR